MAFTKTAKKNARDSSLGVAWESHENLVKQDGTTKKALATMDISDAS